MYSVIPPYTLSMPASLNFCENGNFKYFAKNVFAIDPHGQKERCGMATLLQNDFLQQSKDMHNIQKNWQYFLV